MTVDVSNLQQEVTLRKVDTVVHLGMRWKPAPACLLL